MAIRFGRRTEADVAKSPSVRLVDGAMLRLGDAPVRFKVNRRARRISLRIDAARGEVVATAPDARRLNDALAFAESRRDWIAERLEALPQSQHLVPGMVLQVDGTPCRLDRAAMRIKPRWAPPTDTEPARLIVSGEGEVYARAAHRALKVLALERLRERTAYYTARLSLPLPQLAVTEARTRWGSCRQGRPGVEAVIRYNWRLVLAPPWVLNYVAAHEVAHLIEANHSPRYWAVVAELFGDHRPARNWLRVHGADLYAIGSRP